MWAVGTSNACILFLPNPPIGYASRKSFPEQDLYFHSHAGLFENLYSSGNGPSHDSFRARTIVSL